jgi:NADPH-dependent 7-cyano-7-deazaguanine reductase QueF-like protein
MDTSGVYENSFVHLSQPAPSTFTTPPYTAPMHNYSAPTPTDFPPVQIPKAFKRVIPAQPQQQASSHPHSHSVQTLPPLPVWSLKSLTSIGKANLQMTSLEQQIKALKNPNPNFHEKKEGLSQIIMQLGSPYLNIDSNIRHDLVSHFSLKMAYHLLTVNDGRSLNYHSTYDNQTLLQVLDHLKRSETNLQLQTGQNLWINYEVSNFDDAGNFLIKNYIALKDAKLAIRESLIAFLKSFCTLKMAHAPLSENDPNAASKAMYFLAESKKALASYSQILDAELQMDFSSLSIHQGILHQEIARQLVLGPTAQNTPSPQNS